MESSSEPGHLLPSLKPWKQAHPFWQRPCSERGLPSQHHITPTIGCDHMRDSRVSSSDYCVSPALTLILFVYTCTSTGHPEKQPAVLTLCYPVTWQNTRSDASGIWGRFSPRRKCSPFHCDTDLKGHYLKSTPTYEPSLNIYSFPGKTIFTQ